MENKIFKGKNLFYYNKKINYYILLIIFIDLLVTGIFILYNSFSYIYIVFSSAFIIISAVLIIIVLIKLKHFSLYSRIVVSEKGIKANNIYYTWNSINIIKQHDLHEEFEKVNTNSFVSYNNNIAYECITLQNDYKDFQLCKYVDRFNGLAVNWKNYEKNLSCNSKIYGDLHLLNKQSIIFLNERKYNELLDIITSKTGLDIEKISSESKKETAIKV